MLESPQTYPGKTQPALPRAGALGLRYSKGPVLVPRRTPGLAVGRQASDLDRPGLGLSGSGY